MDRPLQDLRYGLRVLSKSPSSTAIAVVALALGIGANSAIFSLINAVLLRPLPFPEAHRIVQLSEVSLKTGGEGTISYPNFRDWRDQSQTLEAVGSYRTDNVALGGAPEPTRIPCAFATSGVLKVLGVKPVYGRLFVREEDQPGAPLVVLLGRGLWQRRFGSDPSLVGKTVQLDARSFKVVGIMPEDFAFGDFDQIDLWAPLATNPAAAEAFGERGRHFLKAVARLRPGVSLEQAQAEMTTIAKGLAEQYPGSNKYAGVRLVPLHAHITGQSKPALLVLLAAVCLVLLIACANVANLLLARTTARQRELAVRLALGASRGRLIRQLLIESVLLSACGGGLGLLLSLWGVDFIVNLGLDDISPARNIHVDGMVLAFTSLVSILTGLIFGMAPALGASKPVLLEALKEGAGRLSSGSPRHRLQNTLVIGQVGLALVLLVSATLMMKSMIRLSRVNPGFQADTVLTLQVPLPDSTYPREEKLAFYRRLLEKVESLPGVESVGGGHPLPFSHSTSALSFEVEGDPLPLGVTRDSNVYFVSKGYFQALGIPLKVGRVWERAEEWGEKPQTLIINESMARRFWPNESSIGKRIRPNQLGWRQVIGVVGDVKHESLDGQAPLQLYVPYAEERWPVMTLVVRPASDPRLLVGALRKTVRDADPSFPVSDPLPMSSLVSESTFTRRSIMVLLGLFASLALALSVIGIYGVISYTVAQRTHEIGIRMALGARASSVLRLIVGHGLLLTLVGLALGLLASLLATRLLSSFLYGVGPTDPATFTGIAVILAGVALVASYLPARRATRIDPMIALRSD